MTPVIGLRPAEASDAEALFEWANDPEARSQSFSQEPIRWEDHLAWFNMRLNDVDSSTLIVEADGVACGVVRLDTISVHRQELSINVSPTNRGRGIGWRAIAQALADVFGADPDAEILARIKHDNRASRSAFERAGFREVGYGDDGELIYFASGG